MSRKLWASVAASGLVAVCEYAFLSSFARQSITSPSSGVVLVLLMTGNLIPYALLASASFTILDRALTGLQKHLRRAGLALAASTGLLALPYGAWLSIYTFSGAHASQLSGRKVYMVIESLLVAGSFAVAAWSWARRRQRGHRSWIRAVGLVGLGVGFAWLSQNVHAGRYEPLHAFLGIWSLVFTWLGLYEALEANPSVRPSRIGSAIGATGLLVVAASVHLLSYAREDLAWIVWSETPVSSYMTHRLRLPSQRSTERVAAQLPPVNPTVDSDRTIALRAERRNNPAPNIVVFFIDNVQADHVGAYGYERQPTTPSFDAMAERGVLFERAYASYPQTRSFTSALLLGRFVPLMRSHNPPENFAEQAITRLLKQERDYHIFAQGWFEASSTGDLQPEYYRIDTFSKPPHDNDPRQKGPWPIVPMEAEFEKILAHLDEASQLGRPAFVWTHLIYPHWNKKGVMVGSERFPFGDDLSDRYDSAIADCDAWIPRLDEAIRRALPDRETVWILGSDHGAGLGRYDKMHGKTIYDVHVKVPFLIVAPGIEPARISVPVDVSLDSAATILDLAGIEPPRDYDGISLVPMMLGEPPVERPILLNHRGERYKGVVFREWKLIRTQDATILFDLIQDPQERMNLAGEYPGVVEQLAEVLDSDLTRRLQAFAQE